MYLHSYGIYTTCRLHYSTVTPNETQKWARLQLSLSFTKTGFIAGQLYCVASASAGVVFTLCKGECLIVILPLHHFHLQHGSD